MKLSEYHVVTNWRVRARAGEVQEILGDCESWTRWWRAAFLRVEELFPGDDRCLGKVGRVHSKGWLPYTLRFQFRISDCQQEPERVTIAVTGDFEGRCICACEPCSEGVSSTFDWQVLVRKPFVRYLSWAFKPVFRANHLWVMRQERRGLELELARRRVEGSPLIVPIPAAREPTFPYGPRHRWILYVATRLSRALAPSR